MTTSLESKVPEGYIQGIVVTLDGKDYYLAGPILENQANSDKEVIVQNVPGHYWKQTRDNRIEGLHYYEFPHGEIGGWASNIKGEPKSTTSFNLLFVVDGLIDTWSEEKEKEYIERGFVHYHEFVNTETGAVHPNKVLWLKHTVIRSFNFDGGLAPELAYEVQLGINFKC